MLEQNRSIAHELTKEEQFLMKIMTVPGIKAHLQCLEIKFNFAERFLVLNRNLQALRRAVIAIEDNKELRQVFVILLKIGNYLN